ncbi:MAG: beta-phosphoglucomutase family hydrolase [Candidatus Aenigmatarchaeota archaeon]
MSLKGAIFDLDGVVIDTVDIHFKAWKKIGLEYGKDVSFEDYKEKIDGIPRIDGARAILAELSEEELRKASERKQMYFLELIEEDGVKVYEGSIDLIKRLKDSGIKIAVISSSKNCSHLLKRAGIEDLFDVIITGYDVKRGKPAPDVFILASEKLCVKPSECIVFEDAILGVEAAKRGGFKCVAIDRYNDPSRLSRADLVINDLSRIDITQLKGLL